MSTIAVLMGLLVLSVAPSWTKEEVKELDRVCTKQADEETARICRCLNPRIMAKFKHDEFYGLLRDQEGQVILNMLLEPDIRACVDQK